MGTGTPANAGILTKIAATPARVEALAGAIGKEENQAWEEENQARKTKERIEPKTGQNGTDEGYTTKPRDTPTNTPRQSEPGGEEPTSVAQETKKASRNPTQHRLPHSP